MGAGHRYETAFSLHKQTEDMKTQVGQTHNTNKKKKRKKGVQFRNIHWVGGYNDITTDESAGALLPFGWAELLHYIQADQRHSQDQMQALKH